MHKCDYVTKNSFDIFQTSLYHQFYKYFSILGAVYIHVYAKLCATYGMCHWQRRKHC